VREFKQRYAEAEGALLGQFPPSPKRYGGTCRGKFFDHDEKLGQEVNNE
jgi:hypothetical protein